MRSSWRTIVAGLTLALGVAAAALVPPAHAAGITIAIAPGPGGSAPGAVANGLREKDLTLAVSLALKEELESYDGVRVVMTRTTDTRPSENTSADLSSRVEMAAAADADALVSIHFNSGAPIARVPRSGTRIPPRTTTAPTRRGAPCPTPSKSSSPALVWLTAASRRATTPTATTRMARPVTTTPSSASRAKRT